MKTIPYTTSSGLKIGCNYQPPRQITTLSRTETMLQNSMLKRKQSAQTDWDGVVIVVGCIAAIVIVYLWVWVR